MIRGLKTFLASLRAAGLYGKAVKSQGKGDSKKALDSTRKILAILAHPSIIRDKPLTATMISLATLMVEYHSEKLGEQGASVKDLTDSLAFLRMLDREPGPKDLADRENIQYLEAKLLLLNHEACLG